MYLIKITFYIFMLMSISVPFVSFAEMGIGGDNITIEVNPENQEPGQEVNVNITSYATDLSKAFIEWKNASGKVLSSGIGNTSYSLITSISGESVDLEITIDPIETNEIINKQISINSSSSDILWQVQGGHTPPFYKGKALPTSESIIRAVAFPNKGNATNIKNQNVYTWKLEHNTIAKASGYSKDVFEFKNSYLRKTENIDLVTSSVNSNGGMGSSIQIPIVNAKLIFYLKNNEGVTNYAKALKTNDQISGNESTIVAEPYFFPKEDLMLSSNYNWKINGEDINTPKNPLVLTVRPTSTGGYATISLSIDSLSHLFQSVSNSLKLNL